MLFVVFSVLQYETVLHDFVLPCLVREEITKSKFNTMIGLVDRERVDEALYDDFESEKAREVILTTLSISLSIVGALRRGWASPNFTIHKFDSDTAV